MSIKSTTSRLLVCLSVVLIFSLWPYLLNAGMHEINPGSRILLLNSYHPQYSWTDQVVNAISGELVKMIPRENLDIEYMDSRRHESEEYFELLHQLYRLKYQFANSKYDVIIVSDDNAFNFLVKYRDSLFSDVPVVFCGINFFDENLDRAGRWFTGIVESDSIRDNIDLIRRIHPDLDRIIILTDQSRMGLSLSGVAHRIILENKAERPVLEQWTEFSLESLYSELKQLSPRTAVFLNTIQMDRNGKYFSYSDDLPELSRICPVPVYGQFGIELESGIVGGILNDAARHGKNAVELATRILRGEKAADIPIQTASYEPGFDFQQLKRFGIDKSILPPDSLIVNRPVSFLDQHIKIILTASIIIFILMVVVLILLFNIRKRISTEHALRDSERKYKRFFEEDLTGDFIADANGKVIDCNPAFSGIFGFHSILEPIGYQFGALFTDFKDYETCMNLLQAQDRISDYEVDLTGKDGRQISVIANLSIRRNPDGSIHNILGYLFDTTERKQLEKQLLRSQKIEAIGQLAGSVAHDFNNLTAIILGYSEIGKLKLSKTNPLWKNFNAIYDAGAKAADLTSQLLAFSSRQAMSPKIINIGDIINNMSGMIKSFVGDDVELELSTGDKYWNIKADPVKIEQIILNLSLNAREAMPKGGKLRIKTNEFVINDTNIEHYTDLLPGVYVLLTFTDTGIGMDRSIRKQIFEPFFTTKEKGTGLGLSTIHGIVQQHKGHINIFSEPKKGTTFKIFFPIADEELTQENIDSRAPSMPGGTERILVVDDNASIRQLIIDILTPLGYSVIEADNGYRAIEVAEKPGDGIDLLLTDVIMPGMNGKELAEKLKSRHPNVRIIFMSGYADNIINGDKGSRKNFHYIPKPIIPTVLAAMIRQVLEAEKE